MFGAYVVYNANKMHYSNYTMWNAKIQIVSDIVLIHLFVSQFVKCILSMWDMFH